MKFLIKHKKRLLINFLGISVGAVFFGMGLAWFLVPYKVAPGGLAGLSQIFYHFFGIPSGAFMLVLNIPLFLIGLKVIGKQFGIGTLYGIFASSFFTDLLSMRNLAKFDFMQDILLKYNTGKPIADWAMTDSTLLAALAGSILLGSGIGLIFRFRGSTGGTDIPAAIIKKYFNTSMTISYLVIEFGIILLIGIVFEEPNLIIWGFATLFLASKVCDLVMEGLPYIKSVYIISDKHEEIKQQIFTRMDRGVTLIHGEGGYQGKPKKIILCTINRRQVGTLREIVKDLDEDAFVILNDISDVMGYGFKSRHVDMSDK